MTRDEVIAFLTQGEEASFAVDALLHLLEMASWRLCSNLVGGEPVTMEMVYLASTIDRTVELVRKQHTIELEAVTAAAFEFVPRSA